ncbi:hypothetical protein NIES2104_05310 [Leptolyngbya sp. NIES-2104]|nr:hypothetical protein NIES2104_05310 [Leptolyngbya sp. NIES-2104]
MGQCDQSFLSGIDLVLEVFEKLSFLATSRPEMNFGLIGASPLEMD